MLAPEPPCAADLYPEPRNPLNPDTDKADSIHRRLKDGKPSHEFLHETDRARTMFTQADDSTAAVVETAIQRCVDEFARLDITVNNASVSGESTHLRSIKMHETSEDYYGHHSEGYLSWLQTLSSRCCIKIFSLIDQTMTPLPQLGAG